MRFQLNMKCDNAAFEDGNGNAEIARILRRLADNVEEFSLAYDDYVLMDVNGNRVGEANIIR